MKQIKFILLIAIILSACSSSPSSIPEKTPTATIEPSPIPDSTSTPQPTNSPEPSPTATIDYQSLTTEEKIQLSQSYVDQANTYSGEVHVELELNGTTYNIYWDSVKNGWRSDHNTPIEELDKMGESFPDLTISGYENPDGSLVLVDPATGKETVFPNPILPQKGETSLHDFYNLSQTELGSYVIDDIIVPSLNPDNQTGIQMAEAMKQQALFLGGYICNPEQNNFYAGLGSGGNEKIELPEENAVILERPTNQFCIPIYSPETGDFMFFLNIQQGNATTLFFEYSIDGTVKAYQLAHLDYYNFGNDGKDQFGIIVENRRPDLSHYEGGLDPLLQGNTGIGSIADAEEILNARSEKEILEILKKFKIFVSYPKRIVAPKN